MRIIAGKYKGRQLDYPKNNPGLRPTKDMVREALFSIIQNRITGASFLDLFAGCGAVGLEALSRGVQKVVMIDKNPRYIYENIRKLNIINDLKVYKNDSLRAIEILYKKGAKFDLIFVDPPYQSDLMERSLQKIERFDILNKNGLIILETAKNTEIQANFNLKQEKFYGFTKLLFLER